MLARGVTGPEGPRFRPPESRPGDQPRHHDRRRGGNAALCRAYQLPQAHEAIARARAGGKRVYGEPLIQHLLLDARAMRTGTGTAARRVMSPPFRDKVHRTACGRAAIGSLQVVATDHCAFTTEQKRIGLDDFRKIPNGTGGLEDRMPLLWTSGANTGRLTKEEFVAVTSANIARILNIYPRKGRLAAGSDADIVVWDPGTSKTITAKKQVSRIDYNVFEGFACMGAPVATLSRGKVAFAEGELRAGQGDGQYVERPAFSPVHVANSTWKLHSAPQAVRRLEVTP